MRIAPMHYRLPAISRCRVIVECLVRVNTVSTPARLTWWLHGRWIGKFDADLVLDYIPLHEVKRVASRAKERMSVKMQLQLKLQKSLSGIPQSLEEEHPGSESEGEDFDFELDDSKRWFAVKTIDDGANGGKTTVLLASSAAQCTKWVEAIEHAAMDEHLRTQDEALRMLTPVRRAQVYLARALQRALSCLMLPRVP